MLLCTVDVLPVLPPLMLTELLNAELPCCTLKRVSWMWFSGLGATTIALLLSDRVSDGAMRSCEGPATESDRARSLGAAVLAPF